MNVAVSHLDSSASTAPELAAVAAESHTQRVKPGPTRRRRRRLTVLVWQLMLAGALLGLWQLAHVFDWARPLVVQSPKRVWDAGFALQDDGLIWPALRSTLGACMIALALATLIGVGFGLVLALLPRVEEVVNPFLTAMNSAPRIAFAPVFIIVFGIGTSAKVALAFSVVVFVLILNSRAGVHAADPDTVRLMKVLGASKRQIFTRLLLPVAVPSIFAGLRLGLIYSLLGVVTSEMIAARVGMGQLIARFSANFELDKVYALIFVLIVVATLLNAAMGLIERRLLWWQPPAGAEK